MYVGLAAMVGGAVMTTVTGDPAWASTLVGGPVMYGGAKIGRASGFDPPKVLGGRETIKVQVARAQRSLGDG